MALTGRTVAAAVVLAVAAFVFDPPTGTLWWLNLLLLALVLLDVALAAPVGSLQLTRSGATQTRLGEPVEVAVLLANRSSRAMRGWVRDAWPPSTHAEPERHRVAIPAGERRRLLVTLTPRRRGDWSPAGVTVRSVGPLGLAARQGRHAVPWRLRVLPPFRSRRHLPERLDRLRQLDGAVLVRGRGQGTEFDSLREYVEGDDVRSIDWRATARANDVVVRTWRPERDRRVILAIDTGRTSAGRVADEPRLDHALDAALLLGALASRAGDQVDLIAHDRLLRANVAGGTRAEVLPTLVQAMATLEPVLLEADHRAFVSAILRRARRRALVVLFTDLNAAVIEESLLPALPSLTNRHTVVLAAVSDPHVAALAGGRADVSAVYAAAAAERSLAERRRLTSLLRRRGVEVVDAPPADFAPAVADTYLDLKAAGRL